MSATDTVLYFKKDSADLTSDDRAALDSYAVKYVAAGSTDQVTVTGWASMEGDKNYNETLAKQRAKAVADYLASKGISKIAHDGPGPTDKFGSDLKANRCATIEPKPPAPASPGATSSPAPAPTPPQPAPVQPPVSKQDLQNLDFSTVPRSDVESFLTDFLTQLQASQKLQSGVRVTDKVLTVARMLGDGMPSTLTKLESLLRNDQNLHKPSELARAIARCLPDRIPAANYGKAVDQVPKDYQISPPQSFSDALAKIVGKDIVKAISGLPKPIRDAIEKGISDAIATGVTKGLQQALSQSQLSGQVQNAITNSVEAALKLKESGPPMDRKQDTSGPGAPDRDPPQRTPPQASPQPPGVPGESIVKTPSVNTPDTPPPKSSPKTDGGP